MNNSFSDSYKAAGVDVTAGYRAVELMKAHVARTMTGSLSSEIGGFGGLFPLDVSGCKEPVLCAGTDGVGTKLKLAFLLDKHDTIGIDCVAMCVNDILCCGAKPLFFLDYIACGKNVPEKIASIVSGVADGCVQAGCSLIGGETAEMPGFYPENEYDLAGFSVGVVDRPSIPQKNTVTPGDVLIGLPSSGLHSNGYSLIRKIWDVENTGLLSRHHDELGMTLGEALLCPTKIYVNSVLPLFQSLRVKSAAHITGGGFYENIPRALPDSVHPVIDTAAIPINPLFSLVQHTGSIPLRDMYNTFNMGVGFVLVMDPLHVSAAMSLLTTAGERPFLLGHIAQGDGEVVLQ